jgi:hypothetical protein
LGFESSKFLGVIRLNHFFDHWLHQFSDDSSDFSEWNFTDHFWVGHKVLDLFFLSFHSHNFHPSSNSLIEVSKVWHDICIVVSKLLEHSLWLKWVSSVYSGIEGQSDLDHMLESVLVDVFTVFHEPFSGILHFWAVVHIEGTILHELAIPSLDHVETHSHTEHSSRDTLSSHIGSGVDHLLHLSGVLGGHFLELGKMSGSLGHESSFLGFES